MPGGEDAGGGEDGGGLAGGAAGDMVVAVAMKMRGLPESPVAVANNELPPPLPSVHFPTVAIPSVSVFAVSPVTEPPPLRMLNVTVTPGTGTPVAVVTLTAGLIATAERGAADCPSPAKIATVVGTSTGAGGAGGAAGGADGGAGGAGGAAGGDGGETGAGGGGGAGGGVGGGGCVAFALITTEAPLGIVAVTEFAPATFPRVHRSAVAIPEASVATVAGEIDPPPAEMANVTVAPETANPN